ncbi:hypothetical protein J2T12_005113 [Paenibacillus anaericanus]|uniref:hypothetical protein n=1 Tax=Paenibacillus anaericanus TaxID=170367 RepID=UPI00277E99A5|nr:hypothetical protein [Paenibacillus anaericanus]MDQ0091673.1 hypothetical protein [Paenibacillus anaericanus]
MYPISPLFADLLRRPDREFFVKAIIDNKEYDNTKLVDFNIENSLSLTYGFQLGTAIPSKLTIKLRTNDEIPSNSRVVPYLALSTARMTWLEAKYPWKDMHIPWNGSGTGWLPLGEFFVDSREKAKDVWTYVCYDKLVFADVAYVSQLNYPATQKAVFDEICTSLGWTYDSSVVINSAYKIQAGPAGYSMRQVLAYIASANSASIYIDKAGMLKFKRFSASEEPVFSMKASDYMRAKQTNPMKTFTRVVVTYNTEDQLTYEAGTGDENHTLYVENPFATQAITNALLTSLNGFTYLPIQMDARGFPQLSQGDVISFEQHESSTWLETVTAWKDTHIPWDGIRRYKTVILHQVFDFKGGLKMSLEAPSVSEQQSEFAVDGTLTTAVNKLNKDAVKFGKPYYGVSHSRTQGIIVEREDHLSKAVFNSDELSFYAGSDKALYFDIPSRKFKFNGTLEAVDGKFTGTIESGKFIGGTIDIGSGNQIFKAGPLGIQLGNTAFANAPFSVNMSGHFKAVGGEFSGEISASIINGGQINGTSINGVTVTGSTISTRYGNSKGIVMNSGWADLEIYSGVSSTNRIFAIEDLGNDAGIRFDRDGQILAGRVLDIRAPDGVFVNGVRVGG